MLKGIVKAISKVLHNIFRFLKIILFCSIVSYILFLNCGGPKFLIDSLIENNVSDKTFDFEISEITGLFPFKFKIDQISIKTEEKNEIKLDDIKFIYNWKNLGFGLSIHDGFFKISHAENNPSEAVNKTCEHYDKGAIYNALKNNISPQILRFVYKIEVKNLSDHGDTRFSFALNTKNEKEPTLTLNAHFKNNSLDMIIKKDLESKDENIFNVAATYRRDEDLIFSSQGLWNFNETNIFSKIKFTANEYKFLDKSEMSFEASHEAIADFLSDLKVAEKPFLKANFVFYVDSSKFVMRFDVSNKKNIFVELYKNSSLIPVNASCATDDDKFVDVVEKNINEYVKIGELKLKTEDENNLFHLFYRDDVTGLEANKKLITDKTVGFVADDSHFSIDGSYNRECFKINKIDGKISGKKVSSDNIFYDLKAKKIGNIKLKIDNNILEIKDMFVENLNKINTKFALNAFDIYKENEKNVSYYGTCSLDGTATYENSKIDILLKFVLKDKKNKIAGINKKLFNPLQLSADGAIRLTNDSLDIEKCNLRIEKVNKLDLGMKFLVKDGNIIDIFNGINERIYKTGKVFSHKGADVLLDGKITGDFRLSPISVFLGNGDVIDGDVDASLNISGSVKETKIKGHFNLKNGSYENISNGIILKNVELKAVGDGDKLTIKTVRLLDGTKFSKTSIGSDPLFNVYKPPAGTGGGHGFLYFYNKRGLFYPEIDLNLKLNFFQVAYSKVVKARATGDLRLFAPVDGKKDSPAVTGEVVVDSMLINLDDVVYEEEEPPNIHVHIKGKKIKSKKNDKNKETQDKKVAIDNRFNINVGLQTGDKVTVRGSEGLQCFLVGKIFAKGKINEPYLLGELSLDKKKNNKYNLFGKIMKVQDGSIRYDSEKINDPFVKIRMAVRINQKDIFINLNGYSSNANISLSSNPAMSNDDILALLLFRQGLNELSYNQNLRVKTFSTQLLQNNPLGFVDKLRDKMGIDTVEFVETQNLSSGEVVQSVRVGKQIKKVRVNIDSDIASKNNSKMTVRYDITNHLGVEANVSTEKDKSGVGVNWIRRY